MGIFADADEVDRHVGDFFRHALADLQTGPGLRSAGVTLRLVCHDPDCEIVLRLVDPVCVSGHGLAPPPVVTLGLRADLIDAFLRGTYSLVEGMARDQIDVKGPVSRVLRVLANLETPPQSYRSPVRARATISGTTPPRPRTADGVASRSNVGSTPS